jgi:hypothetical protein
MLDAYIIEKIRKQGEHQEELRQTLEIPERMYEVDEKKERVGNVIQIQIIDLHITDN